MTTGPRAYRETWQATWRRRLSWRGLENAAYDLVGTEYGGMRGVPLSGESLQWFPDEHHKRENDYHVAAIQNDGFEIGFGYSWRWCYTMRRHDVHRVIRWYLGLWAFKEWFGVRRWLFLTLLHRRVERHRHRMAG